MPFLTLKYTHPCAAFGVEGTIVRRFDRGRGGIRGVVTEDEVTSHADVGVADREIGCVRIYVKAHFAFLFEGVFEVL